MSARRNTKPFGQHGEQLAANYLTNRGFSIVATNWRCSLGELDIIARDDATLVFVEVRTRRADTTEPAFESITPNKRRKLTQLAYRYLEANELSDLAWRVDVVAIGIPRSGAPIIEHIEDALDW
jgi:putative endonuclease